jgi:hypothetical protein
LPRPGERRHLGLREAENLLTNVPHGCHGSYIYVYVLVNASGIYGLVLDGGRPSALYAYV